MHWYCGSCWNPTKAPDEPCSRCGADPSTFSSRTSYVDKLLRATEHPDAVTVRRAVWILGEIGGERAVKRFDAMLDGPTDLYLALAILDSAERIGAPATHIVERILSHPSSIVRTYASRAIENDARHSAGEKR